MTELETVLSAFLDATGCDAAVWVASEGGRVAVMHDTPRWRQTEGWVPTLASGPPRRERSPVGDVLVAAIPGPRSAWLLVGPCDSPDVPLERHLKFLLPVVSQYLQAALEVEHAATELAERYEEINLLYTITEILGRTVSMEEAAATILKEISETVGARRGCILVHDRVTDTLQVVAAAGIEAFDVPPIALDDECSMSARVFREQRAMIADDGPGSCDAEALLRRGAMLSVPIMWTSPAGGG
ncbi:MAG: GAF domain-containing protein, partial [Gemmatimonadaceae bacterium]